MCSLLLRWSPSQTSSSHDTKRGANTEFGAPLNDPEKQSIAAAFQESTCQWRGRGQTRQRQEAAFGMLSLSSMWCQPIGSNLSARDLAGNIGNDPEQHRVLRTGVFLIQLAQRNF